MTGAWRVRFSDRGRSARFTPLITRVNRVLEHFSPGRRNRGEVRNRPPTPLRRRRRTVSDSSNNISVNLMQIVESPMKERANTISAPTEIEQNGDADRIERIKEHCQCTICLGLLTYYKVIIKSVSPDAGMEVFCSLSTNKVLHVIPPLTV